MTMKPSDLIYEIAKATQEASVEQKPYDVASAVALLTLADKLMDLALELQKNENDETL